MRNFLLALILFASNWSAFAQAITTKDAPQPLGPYSQAIASGDFVYVSGQVGRDPIRRELAPGGTAAECKQIMTNIQAILKEAGCQLKDIVSTTIYLTDVADFAEVNKIYGSYFEAPYPARTTVGVAALPGGSHIEITVIARKR